MPAKNYRFIYDEYGNTREIKVRARGIGDAALDHACAIRDAPEARRHDAEKPGDAGQQKHGCDGERDHARDSFY